MLALHLSPVTLSSSSDIVRIKRWRHGHNDVASTQFGQESFPDRQHGTDLLDVYSVCSATTGSVYER